MTSREAGGASWLIQERGNTGRAIRTVFRAVATALTARVGWVAVALVRFRNAGAAMLKQWCPTTSPQPRQPLPVVSPAPPKSYTVPVRRVGPDRSRGGPMSRGELYEYYKRIGRLEMFFALFGDG